MIRVLLLILLAGHLQIASTCFVAPGTTAQSVFIELPSLVLILREITSLDNLLWIVAKYQDVQKNAEDALTENCLIYLDDLLRDIVIIQRDLQ